MNWKPGDVALIVGCTWRSNAVGMECEVIGPSTEYVGALFVDIPSLGKPMTGHWSIFPRHLMPLRPPHEAARQRQEAVT